MSRGDLIRLRKFHAKKDLWTIFNKLKECIDDADAEEKLRKLIQDTINAIDILVKEDS